MIVDQIVESCVWNGHTTLIGIDGAERKVLSGCCALGEHIEECWFADIWHADDTHTQIGTDATDQWLLLWLFDLFWWHLQKRQLFWLSDWIRAKCHRLGYFCKQKPMKGILSNQKCYINCSQMRKGDREYELNILNRVFFNHNITFIPRKVYEMRSAQIITSH